MPETSSNKLPLLTKVLLGLAWVALTVNFFFPTRVVLDAGLDNSNYGSYSYFTAKGFHYGSEVMPMCGPYGFVMYGFLHSGYLFWVRLLAEFCLKGILAALVLWLWRAARATPVLRWFWLASLVLFMVRIEDYPEDWLILLGGLWIIAQVSRPGARYWPLVMTPVLGFVALIKGTHLVLALVTLGVALLPALARRDWKQIAAMAGGFVGSLLLWWLAAGQRLGDLPVYVHGILELSSGYNLAMTLDESDATFWRGVSLTLLLISLCLGGIVIRRRQVATVAGLLLLAGFSFLQWKHGFVRADGHIFILFCFGAVAAPTWPLVLSGLDPAGSPLPRWGHRLALVLSGGAFILALYGLGSGEILRVRWVYEYYPVWLREKVTQLLDVRAAKTLLDAELESHRKFYSMPASRQLVGARSIDVFGFTHGITLLNNLDYRPRPIGGGSFSTFTPYLMRLNGAFMDDPARRPDFFLLQYATVDERLAAADDPLTFFGLIDHYAPVLVEQGYVLFETNSAASVPARQAISTTTFHFNETVKPPDVPTDRMLLASFEIKPSLFGRIRSTLYKPPPVFINQQGKGVLKAASRRLVPSMATLPFPLSPVIETNDDVLGLYTRQAGKSLYSFTLTTDLPAAFSPEIKVTFSTRPRPPLPDRTDIDELITSSRYPLTNVRPEVITPADAPLRLLGGMNVQMLLPPAELVWKLEGTEREFLFDYGYEPTAYEKGLGDGTVFIVEIRSPDRSTEELFRKLLDPSHRPADRETQTARIILPGAIRAGSRLVLRTDPGANGDNAWDWAFATKIQLKRGPYSPRQFPNFNRVPTFANTEHASLVDTDKGRGLQLHAPGYLDFQLTGDETSVKFDYGFMPGAYTGQGATDGAVYLVELVRPNQPRITLLRRHLEPRSRIDDQGRQHAELTLPKLGPADHLFLTIDPGPAGNNSWDWTYVTNFEIK